MEVNTQRRADGLRDKLPEMKGTLDVVKLLRVQKAEDEDAEEELEGATKELEATFSLNDTLYAKAEIIPKKLEEVYLWLGASVMVAYPIDEAETMLKERLESTTQRLQECEEDLEFLREQVTVRSPFWQIDYFSDQSGLSVYMIFILVFLSSPRCKLTQEVDLGSSYRSSIQLGCHAEETRESRGQRRRRGR